MLVDANGTETGMSGIDLDTGKFYFIANPKSNPKYVKVKALPVEGTDYEIRTSEPTCENDTATKFYNKKGYS